MRSARRAGTVLLGTAALLGLAAGPVAACVEPVAEGPSQAFEVVLDASGSMRGPDGAGEERFTTATRVVRRFVDEVPAGVALGLRVYGSRVAVGDPEAGCRDSSQLVPVEPVDRPALRAALGRVEPRGYTPIGRSLREAAEALPEASDRRVLLVSDGIDSCELPPCEVARQIAATRPDVVVDTVGFTVPEAQAGELRCIAEVTGGRYVEAIDARTLFRAFRSYLTEGRPVTGGATPSAAEPVREGQYLDELALDAQRWYRVDVEGLAELTASATLVPGEGRALPDTRQRLTMEVRVPDVVGDLVCDRDVVETVGLGLDHVAATYSEPPGTPGPCGEPGARLVGVRLEEAERQPRLTLEEPPPPPVHALEVVLCGETDVASPARLDALPVAGELEGSARAAGSAGSFPPRPVLTGFAAGLAATLLLVAARGRRGG